MVSLEELDEAELSSCDLDPKEVVLEEPKSLDKGRDEEGRWIRLGVNEFGESTSTLIPVVLGERGDAMMGAGIVRRLRYVGVLCKSVCARCREGA